MAATKPTTGVIHPLALSMCTDIEGVGVGADVA